MAGDLTGFGPLERFLRAKRWMAIFSGLALLHLIVGISQGESGGFIGVTIDQPEYLDDVFILLAVFFFFQAANMRTLIDDQFRSRWQYRIDDVFSVIIFSFSGSLYIANLRIFGQFEFTIGEILLVLTTFLAFVIGSAAAALTFWRLRITAIKQGSDEDTSIIEELIFGEWTLVYAMTTARATHGERGTKTITFLPDGDIGEGKNHNESTWRVTDGYLEIFNEDRRLFSRFKKARDESGYEATDDADVQSLKGQVIVRNFNNWMLEKKLSK